MQLIIIWNSCRSTRHLHLLQKNTCLRRCNIFSEKELRFDGRDIVTFNSLCTIHSQYTSRITALTIFFFYYRYFNAPNRINFHGKNFHPFCLSFSLTLCPLFTLCLFLSLSLSLFLSHLSRYFLPILCLSFFLTYLPTRPISMLAAVSRPQIIADTMLCRHVYDRHVSCPRIAFVSALISSCPHIPSSPSPES